MGIFAAIVAALASLFGSHEFTDSLHNLASDMGAAGIGDKVTQITTDATALLGQGLSVAETIATTATAHSIPQEHAAMIVAAAKRGPTK